MTKRKHRATSKQMWAVRDAGQHVIALFVSEAMAWGWAIQRLGGAHVVEIQDWTVAKMSVTAREAM